MKDVLKQLARDLKAEKLRTFLTIFGIVWGTVAISLMLAFGTGLHKQLIKSTAGLGDRIVIAWPGLTSIPYEGLGKGRRIRITADDLATARGNVDGLKAISTEYSGNMKVEYGTKTLSVDTSGVDPEFGSMPADTISKRTGTTPAPTESISCAAAIDKSIIRLSTKGPRSVMRTTVDFPLLRFVTRTTVSNGSVRCAAVNLCMS